MPDFIGSIDQGTTSTRCMIFDRQGRIRAQAQKEHAQLFPRPGWVEHDALEIWAVTRELLARALDDAGLKPADLAGLGLSNQRETVLLWDRDTGNPLAPAIVWQCTRTRALCEDLILAHGQDRFRAVTGLPVATYFSGPKIAWLLDNVPGAREGAESGRVLAGTIDSWLIWNLTGGPRGGEHVTDATNASRTMLMDLRALAWDDAILDILRIPRAMLPQIVPSSPAGPWGMTRGLGPELDGIAVCGALGDQQAALMGQACFEPGQAKNTYGTGCFLLLHTGREPMESTHGLISTVAYQLGDSPACYCLEGSVAVAGALIRWLRDNLGLIRDASMIEALALQVEDNGGVYVVPAFSGLFAPHWRPDARGVIAGLTHSTNRGHIARAALEASAFQTWDIAEAMAKDSGVALTSLKVDGGMAVNDLLMQFQADILDIPVLRPSVTETTALGAAYAAGLSTGFWSGLDELRANWAQEREFSPAMGADRRESLRADWRKAVRRTLDWTKD